MNLSVTQSDVELLLEETSTCSINANAHSSRKSSRTLHFGGSYIRHVCAIRGRLGNRAYWHLSNSGARFECYLRRCCCLLLSYRDELNGSAVGSTVVSLLSQCHAPSTIASTSPPTPKLQCLILATIHIISNTSSCSINC